MQKERATDDSISASRGVAAPVSDAEVRQLFADLIDAGTLMLAISGGPDSTALLVLMARWRKSLKQRPTLIAVTVDHGLRPESAGEARAVKRLARSLGVEHRTLIWRGSKPRTGLQQAARVARYGLLAQAAQSCGVRVVLSAHTLDDQAETVLIRLTRGSGLSGLGAMSRVAVLPANTGGAILLVRPLLDVPKARLLATLRAARIRFAEDPSNRDPRFTRVRLRASMPELGREGLSPQRLALLARRLRRADAALEAAVDAAMRALMPPPWPERGPMTVATEPFARLPAEMALRLIGRAISHVGDEGPVELGKIEALYDALAASPATARLRRTLAGALVTRAGNHILIERAPPRRTAAKRP